MPLNLLLKLAVIFFLLTESAYPGEKRGSLVLAFDDGDKNWVTTIAPEMARVGGVATAYVNNFRVHSGYLSFEDLRTLQNRYGWEIGTHTYHHYDATVYIKLHGISQWTKDELDVSIAELQSEGLKVRSLVFPFNKYTEQLRTEALKYVAVFRQYSLNPVTGGQSEDGSLPVRAIDLEHYVPMSKIFGWIETAWEKNQMLLLYGHQVFPDSEFRTGEVESVSESALVAKQAVEPLSKPYSCLVPDERRELTFALFIESIEGTTVKVSAENLPRLTRPGTRFVIGPCIGMRLSDFRRLIDRASQRLNFRTVRDALQFPGPYLTGEASQ